MTIKSLKTERNVNIIKKLININFKNETECDYESSVIVKSELNEYAYLHKFMRHIISKLERERN